MADAVFIAPRRNGDRRLAILGAAVALSAIAYMTIGLRGNLGFVLELRSLRLLALAEVAVAIAVATVVFQTIAANHVLTPSIMGLDSLYLFCQTLLVFSLGGFGYAGLDAQLKFGGEVAIMLGMALLLFLPLLRARMEVTLMLLAGVVVGMLLRSLSALLARMLDPNDYAVLQGASFASFNAVRPDLLAIGAIVVAISTIIAWRARHTLDIIALGADAATGLGVDWRRATTGWLLLVALLSAVSTALVGPVYLFGLLVVAIAERLVGTRRHAVLLPAAALVATFVLVGGQTIFQHGIGGESALSVVIEFLGGLVFLVLLARGRRQ